MDHKNWRKNLGMVLSRLYRLSQETEAMHEDVSLWGAPSECHGDVSRGHDMAVKEEMHRLFALYGVRSLDELDKEYSRRTEGYTAYCHSCMIFGCGGYWDRFDERYRVETA